MLAHDTAPQWPLTDPDRQASFRVELPAELYDIELPEYRNWSDYRKWWQPRFAVAVTSRLPGRVRWLTAWTRAGVERKITAHLNFRVRGGQLAARWLSEPMVKRDLSKALGRLGV